MLKKQLTADQRSTQLVHTDELEHWFFTVILFISINLINKVVLLFFTLAAVGGSSRSTQAHNVIVALERLTTGQQWHVLHSQYTNTFLLCEEVEGGNL